MPPRAFTVFQDVDDSVTATLQTSSSSKSIHAHDTSSATTTKENINPLTGLVFDAQPPLKKRKPSSSSALKVKPLPSSSKPISKSKKLSSSSNGKEKGKKRAVLGSSGSRNIASRVDGSGGSEAEELRTALGNRRAYDFTVMPLANVTQAYDEGEAVRAMARAGECAVKEHGMNVMLADVIEENDIEMCDLTSKEGNPSVTVSVLATEA